MKRIILILLSLTSLSVSKSQWVLNYQTPTNEIVKVSSSPDNNIFWFITNFDRLYKTETGGTTWTMIPHGSISFIPYGLFVVNRDTAFKTSSATILITSDGGNNWNVVFSNSGAEIPEVWMKNNSEGVASFGGHLYKSTDGGNSWSTSLITQPPLNVVNSNGKGIISNSGNNLWVALRNSGVSYSSDFGVSWNLPSNTGLTFASPTRIFFGSPQFGLTAPGNSSFIYATTNGASSWHFSDNSLGFNQDVAINGSHCWYIPDPFDHFYVKYSEDSGATWTQQLNDGSGFNVLEKSRSGNTLWTGTTTGKIYKYIDQIATNVGKSDKIIIYKLDQNFPNPFNPKTIISYQIPFSNYVLLKIYNILGKEVATPVNGKQSGGIYTVKFDAGNLASGFYFYRLSAWEPGSSRSFIETREMLILK